MPAVFTWLVLAPRILPWREGLTEEYPAAAPKVCSVMQISHSNVDKSERICSDVLKGKCCHPVLIRTCPFCLEVSVFRVHTCISPQLTLPGYVGGGSRVLMLYDIILGLSPS